MFLRYTNNNNNRPTTIHCLERTWRPLHDLVYSLGHIWLLAASASREETSGFSCLHHFVIIIHTIRHTHLYHSCRQKIFTTKRRENNCLQVNRTEKCNSKNCMKTQKQNETAKLISLVYAVLFRVFTFPLPFSSDLFFWLGHNY